MTLVRFDPTADLILVNARLWGPLGSFLRALNYEVRSLEGILHVALAAPRTA